MGVDILGWARATTTTPLPIPPPQGGREQAEFAARTDLISPQRTAARAHAVSGIKFSRIAARPVAVFVLLSVIFGIIVVAIAPPLRGPDESAHFLRAYGIAQGDIIPSLQDAAGRKGIPLPLALHRDFSLFETWATHESGRPLQLPAGVHELRNGPTEDAAAPPDPPPQAGRGIESGRTVFVPYGGSEGYSPVAYLPQAAAAWLARAAGLGLSRDILSDAARRPSRHDRGGGLRHCTGAGTAVGLRGDCHAAVGALRARRHQRRCGGLRLRLVVVAMFVRAVLRGPAMSAGTRAAWMLLCALSKPPNLAFVLLEWCAPLRSPACRRDWRALAMVSAPAITAALLWTAVSAGDVAAWRQVELTGAAAEEFDPGWKLRFMLAHPLTFPQAVIGMLANNDPVEFWRQVIGVLGLFDTVLRPWLYSAIGLLLTLSFVSPLEARRLPGCALAALLTAIAYAVAVVLIFYLVWTPVGAEQVWGVQGRYFVPVLPLIAVAIAALLKRGPDLRLTAAFALASALLSGAGAIDAVLVTDWNF